MKDSICANDEQKLVIKLSIALLEKNQGLSSLLFASLNLPQRRVSEKHVYRMLREAAMLKLDAENANQN